MGTDNAGLRHPISASKLPNNFGKMKQQTMKDSFKHGLAGGKLLVTNKKMHFIVRRLAKYLV